MKRGTKIIGLVLAAVLLIGASVFGTMAYLTSKDEVNNTFTVGKVALTLDEAKVDGNGKKITGEGAGRVQANEYKLIPSAVYDKDPTVTVLAGSEEAYVRMLVTINEKAELDAIGFDNMRDVFDGYDENKWKFEKETPDTDNNSMTYEFRYFEKVKASATDTELPALFETLNVPNTLTNEQLATIKDLEIKIVAHAIQTSGFDDAEAAWAAFDA